MIDVIPDLVTCVIMLGFSFGYLISNAGYNFDGEVKYGFGKAWFDSLNLLGKYTIGYLLDIFHHFEFGLLAIILGYLYLSGLQQQFTWYFGWGFIIADFKDFENILIRLGLKDKPIIVEPPIIIPPVGEPK